jgi:hypothetical protein
MEGGWDRPLNHARMLGERDGKDEPLAEGNNGNNDESGKHGNIPNNNKEYAVGIDGVNEPLDKGNNECDTLSAAPARASLRVSGRACPHAESIILSAGGTESMVLSAHAESIILSALPAESMILSQRHPHARAP